MVTRLLSPIALCVILALFPAASFVACSSDSGGENAGSGGTSAGASSGGSPGDEDDPGSGGVGGVVDEGTAGAGSLAGAAGADNLGGGSPVDPFDCIYEYRDGHGDLYIGQDDDGLTVGLRSAFGAAAESVRSLEEACLVVPREARELSEEYGGVPDDDAYSFLGAPPGASFWLLPQAARPHNPWFGFSTEGVSKGGLSKRIELAFRVLEGPTGAAFAVWSTDTLGRPAPILSTADGLLVTSFDAGVHAHFNWSFSEAGNYALEAEANMESGDGALLASSVGILHVEVEP